MIVRVLAKCFSVFIVIFLLCPKPARLSVPIGTQQEYYHAVRRSSPFKAPHEEPSGLRRYLHHYPYPDEVESINGPMKDYEPGFDLTDKEIRKLKLWDKGVVPYYIDVPSFTDKVLRDRIRWFLNMVSSVTSLNFMELPRPPANEKTRWVFFVNRRGQLNCADHSITNFTMEGPQRVVLGYDCMATGGELAEAVLSIAGVPPQHNAPNRDKYIQVLDENIAPEKKYLFKKMKNTEWLFHDVGYDFTSASHFHHHKHSVNGRATILIKTQAQPIDVDKRGFSSRDILKIKMLYNFIVKTKRSKNKVSACNRLFSPGKNFKKGAKSSRAEKSRPKPKKYLDEAGGSDNNEENSGEDDKNVDSKTPSTKANKAQTDNNIKNSKKDIPVRSQIDEYFGRNKDLGNNLNKQPQMKNYYKDPLTYLSDYETGDENYQRSILKRKNDYNGFSKLSHYMKTVK